MSTESEQESLSRNRWGLGVKLLSHDRVRLLVSWAGIAVAVAIMFVQQGLLWGILDSQSLAASLVRGDLVVMNRVRTNLHSWNSFEPIRLFEISGSPYVESVVPVYEGVMNLRDHDSHALRRIVAFAFPPHDVPFSIGDPDHMAQALRQPNAVLFDRRSRNIYGSVLPGQEIELDGVDFRVAGYVDFGADIINDGTVFMSDGTWHSINPDDIPIMGVVRLKPGSDLARARRDIEARVPADVTVNTPEEIRQREVDFTLRSAPIGILFGIGVLAGLVIGAITCYQTLFNEIIDRLPQYATLRAIGFSDKYLQRVIYEQSAFLAVGGFLMGLVFALCANAYISDETALTIRLGAGSIVGTFLLTAAMSLFSGGIAMRLLASARPDELY